MWLTIVESKKLKKKLYWIYFYFKKLKKNKILKYKINARYEIIGIPKKWGIQHKEKYIFFISYKN